MSHGIEDNNAVYFGQPAWHNVGTVITDHNMTGAEVCALGAKNHVYYKCDVSITGTDIMINEHQMVMRDDGKQIGMVGKGFELIQPSEMCQRAEKLRLAGLIEFEAAGLLNEGKRIWVLGKVKNSETEIAKNDSVKCYLLFCGAFDGSLADTMFRTGTRVVCQNTLALARENSTKGERYSFKHTKNVRAKIENAVESIQRELAAFKQATDAMRTLAKMPLTRKAQESYIRRVFEWDTVKPENNSSQLETKVNRVIDLIDDQRGIEYVPAIRGTAWQAYNAVSEYITHEYGRSDDSRLQAQWFGPNRALNDRAMNLALSGAY